MKLSEAILLGSTLSPQCICMFEAPDGSRCALGAALAAVGQHPKDSVSASGKLTELWPHLEWPNYSFFQAGYSCPANCGGEMPHLADAIVHLNDNHHWSREQIAEWVQIFDPPEVDSPALDVAIPVGSAVNGVAVTV